MEEEELAELITDRGVEVYTEHAAHSPYPDIKTWVDKNMEEAPPTFYVNPSYLKEALVSQTDMVKLSLHNLGKKKPFITVQGPETFALIMAMIPNDGDDRFYVPDYSKPPEVVVINNHVLETQRRLSLMEKVR